ncbi:MAG: hypothetical protein ABSG98_06370 [Anaerolineales bacterium]|jgi:hypothetical protein
MKTALGTVIGKPQIVSWPGHQTLVFVLATPTAEGHIDQRFRIGRHSLVAQIQKLRVGSRVKAIGRTVPVIARGNIPQRRGQWDTGPVTIKRAVIRHAMN